MDAAVIPSHRGLGVAAGGISIMDANDVSKAAKYDQYKHDIEEDILNTVELFGCQPILFVGSGLSRRYIKAPSWDELLSFLAIECPTIEHKLGYYKQSFDTHPMIGEEFARLYQTWAWSDGRKQFPEHLFGEQVDKQAYIKHTIAEHLKALTQKDIEKDIISDFKSEIDLLRKIKPHAIITTSYDTLLESIFIDHQPIIGQQILKGAQLSIGEIFKIHGCVTDPDSIVFTQTDYDIFMKKKKFLSAKLLTFFNEHPLIFIGYSATDPNIRAILSDIDEALPEKGGMIPNVYILEWQKDITPDTTPPRDKVIGTDEDRSIRVKLIQASDFGWVFKAFSANPALNSVNPRVLRALLARTYNLIRRDIPKMKVEADFSMLTDAVENGTAFAKLFGIANISDYSIASAKHPFSTTQVAKKLGGKTWHVAHRWMSSVQQHTGIDIRKSDNKYHRAERINKITYHKYSQELVDLLKSYKSGNFIKIEI